MGYSQTALTGVSWLGGVKVITRLVSLGKTAILARLLLPEQFGLYGIAALVLAFLEILTETGINVFLIQEEDDVNKYIDTAWVISLIRGLIMTVVLFLLALPISRFFNAPAALPLLRLASLVPLVKGFINPAMVKLQKQLLFRREFWLRTTIFMVEVVITLLLAWWTRSPASLIWGLIAGGIIEVMLSFLWIKPRPRFKFNLSHLSRILHRGKWVTSVGILSYFSRQGGDMVIAKVLTPQILGFYQMAYRISTVTVTEIGEVTGKVTFPVFVRIGGDKSRLRKAWAKTTLAIAAITLPITVALIIAPRIIISLLLGPNWLPLSPLLQILALFSLVTAMSGPAGAVLYALKMQRQAAIINLVRFLTLAVTVIPLTLKFQAVGAALSSLLAVTVTLPLVYYYLFKIIFSRPASVS